MGEQTGPEHGDPLVPASPPPDPPHDPPHAPPHGRTAVPGPVYGRVTRFGSPGSADAPPPRAAGAATPATRPTAPPVAPGREPGSWPSPPPPVPAAYGAPHPGWPDLRPAGPGRVAPGWVSPGWGGPGWTGPGWAGPGWAGPALGWSAPAPRRPRWRRDRYAPWGRRVLGELVDHAPGYVALVVQLLAYLPLYAGLLRGDLGAQPRWGLLTLGLALNLASIGWNVHNRWIRGGRTGQSLGRRLTGTRLLSSVDGRPVGTLNAFLRDLLHVLDGLAWVGYLWPLWDEERQTFADKIAETVVVRVGEERPDRWV